MIRDEYKKQLKETRDGWEGWGSSAVRNAGPEIVRYLNKHKEIITVLDFGCGTGVLGDYVRENVDRQLVWTEYDPSVEGKDTIPEGVFDLIITVDVMEHIEPESLDETMDWIRQHGWRQYHHIDCNETRDRLPDGRDVHLIVESPLWWKTTLEHRSWVLMEYHTHEKRKRSRMRTSTTIVVERRG